MFDEVALDCGLQYNGGLDCIDGLVDLGGSERRANYADHALVFHGQRDLQKTGNNLFVSLSVNTLLRQLPWQF
jgi:hypothetical protein